jgi:serine/threonine-protein kinase ATR
LRPTDLLYVASLSADSLNITESTCLNLKCFCESFMGIFSDPDHLGDLPESNKPTDGIGIMINLTGKRRWRPFATWIIKLLSRCLTEGTLYVEGLIHASFVSAACSLVCYGDADLQMVGGKSYEFLLLVYRSTCELVMQLLV